MVGGAEVIVRKNIEDLKKNKMKYLLLFGDEGRENEEEGKENEEVGVWGLEEGREYKRKVKRERGEGGEGGEGREGRGGTLAMQHTDANSMNVETQAPGIIKRSHITISGKFKEIYRFDLHLEN